MLKSIYKITNLINGKIYIGQLKNPEKRFYQHIHDNKKLLIHYAISKYGVENFSFCVIENMIENYDEREKFWIKYYRSNEREFGYNLTDGGDCPPILCGEFSNFCKYGDNIIFLLQNDLIENKLLYEEMLSKYGVSNEYITLLNRGKIRNNSSFKYPLRINGNERLLKDVVSLILHELVYTNKSIEKISRENCISSKTIYSINSGTHFYSPKYIEYPIRKKFHTCSEYFINNIIKELLNCKYQFSQIEKMYGLLHTFLSRLNNGVIYKIDGLTYPIRPSSNRVYEPVETIPSLIGSRAAIDTQLNDGKLSS